MKMNAFLRLIRTIACGVVVLGVSNGLAQENDEGGTFGTLQVVDENGDASDETFTQTQAPAASDASGSSSRQTYYPPGTEVPLRETEIPGSAYFTGPDGKRIDASELMNQIPAGQEIVIPSKDSVHLSPGHSFSTEGTYDGTLAFPMGTFPTKPFGERIISQVPAGESKDDKSQSGEIQGALLDANGNSVDVAASNGETPGMENGVPVDQVVRPGDSPKSVVKDEARGKATRVVKPNVPNGIQGLKNKVEIFVDPNTGQVTLIGDDEDTALVANSLADLEKQASKSADKNIAKRQNRLRQRLQEAIDEKERVSGALRKANQKTEALAKEVGKLKEAGKKDGKSRSQLARLTKDLKKAKSDASKAGKKLKEMEADQMRILDEREDMVEAFRIKEKELMTKLKMLHEEGQKNAAQAKAKIAAAEANVEKAKAETQNMVHQLYVKTEEAKAYRLKSDAQIAQAQASAEKARAEALALTEKNSTDETAAAALAAQASAEMANKAREAKAAAELEVSMKLKEMEERKKEADAVADAAEDAGADKGDQGKTAEGEDAKEPVLSLDDQIKRLKAKRDQQIAESETRIRAKQQRQIDKLLEEGKAVDSDEVKAAVEKMKGAIKTSEEKLRSRFLRRLERLKEEMRKSSK